MNPSFLLIAAIPLLALSSCSTIKATAAKVQNSTSKTLATAKEKTLGTSEPKLRLTKADPSRFLPQGTSVDRILIKATPTKPFQKETQLLAKNTKAKSGPRPPKAAPKKASQAVVKLPPIELPPIELPPLPASSKNDNTEFSGILPSLDGNDGATYIDIDGKALELPPMEYPDYEEEGEDEINPEKSA